MQKPKPIMQLWSFFLWTQPNRMDEIMKTHYASVCCTVQVIPCTIIPKPSPMKISGKRTAAGNSQWQAGIP